MRDNARQLDSGGRGRRRFFLYARRTKETAATSVPLSSFPRLSLLSRSDWPPSLPASPSPNSSFSRGLP